MEQTGTTGVASDATTKPTFLKVLCILSFIGSGLWAVLSLIGTFASSWIMSFFMSTASSAMDKVDTSNLTPEQMQAMEAMASGGGMLNTISSYIVVIFIVSLVLSLLSIFGVIRMNRQQKSGFWVYTGVNGIISILQLIGGSWFMGIVGIGFIVMYGLNLKHMK